MSLTQNISQLKDSLYSSGPSGKLIKSSLESSFFTDREIAKNIIKYKSPNITDEAANIMVYGEKTKPANEDNLDSNLKDIKKNNQLKYRYLSKDDQIFKEVSELKTGIINSSFIIVEKSIKLPLDVINLGVMIVNAIPAVTAYTIVGNIPGAINSLLTIKNEVDKLKLHFNELLPHIEMMDKLGLVVGTNSAPYNTIETIMPILNTSLSSLNSFNLSSIDNKTSELKSKETSENTSGGLTSYSEQSNIGNNNITTTNGAKIVNINFFYRDKNNKSFYLDITIISNNSLQLKWSKPSSAISYEYKYYKGEEIKNVYNLGVDISNLEFIIDERMGDKFLKINDLQDKPNILDVLSKLSFIFPSY